MKNNYLILLYMILYCKSCHFCNALEYDSNCHNLFCQSCCESLIGRTGDIELYVTKDSFIHFYEKWFHQIFKEIIQEKNIDF